jgi:hypothetical protein
MPYTYLIGWTKHNKYYYGARWSAHCTPDDLWVTYFTSSKHVKKLREEIGEPDIIQTRKIFEDAVICKDYERRVLIKLKVLNDEKWVNKNINGKFLPHGKQTEEHIKNRMLSLKLSGKNKGRVAWTAATHPEYAKRVSIGLKGKKKTETHRQKMKTRPQNTLILQCPRCNKIGDYKNMKRWHMDKCNQSQSAQ